MSKRKDRPFIHRVGIDITGFSLVLGGVLFSWIPGPGGIPLILTGLAILSLNYEWAEKAVKNLESKLHEYSERFLVNSRKLSITIDVFCFLVIALGFYVALNYETTILRGAGIASISFACALLLANQKRFDRISSRIKNIRK